MFIAKIAGYAISAITATFIVGGVTLSIVLTHFAN